MKSEAKKAAARRYALLQRALRMAEGRCGSCGKPKKNRCEECATRQREYRQARKAAGMCQKCGKRPAAADFGSCCAVCREYVNTKSREAAQTKKTRGLCKCGRILRTNRHNCQHCHDTRPSAKHGLTRIEASQMLYAQQGTCKLCGVMIDPSIGATKAHVDHCHETDRVRGVLCQQCNIALGGLESFWRRGLQDRLAEYLQP